MSGPATGDICPAGEMMWRPLASSTSVAVHHRQLSNISRTERQSDFLRSERQDMPTRLSIFEQEWWYRAATDGNYQEIEYNDGVNIGAKLVFVTRRRRGIVSIGMPSLARVMQPALSYGPGRPKDELYCNVKALKGLAELLPKHDQFTYCLPPESNLELAYCLAGYSASASYTFRSDPSGGHDPWAAMDSKVRSNIKRGAKRLGIEVHHDILRYIGLATKFIKSRSFSDFIDHDAILRIWHACSTRKQASVLSCVNGSGQDLASAILLWDDRHLYYWMSCRNPNSSDNTANSLLIWRAVEIATQAGLTFDIDGYDAPTTGIFKSRFGLLPHRRIGISMISSATRLRFAFSSHLVEMAGPRLRKQLLTARNAINWPKCHFTSRK